jgi:hypothetical protein
MKSILVFVAATLLSTSLWAQKYEIGLNGGISTTTRPHRSLYQGADNVWNYAVGANFHYNIMERIQMGVNVDMTKWERKDQWPLVSANSTDLGTQEVKYQLAKRAVSFTLQLNYVLPFYQQYEEFVRSQLYIGVAAGGVMIGNDAEVVYSKVNPRTPVEYTYASEYHFEPGYGYILGMQIGYTYFISERIGINLDFAPKVTWAKLNDSRYGGANNEYTLIYFPTTIGLHYRFGYDR